MLTPLPVETLGQLVVLALIDSTSFGTLLIPLWLMLAPGRVRPARVLVFLGVVAAFYWVLGIALLLGADALMRSFGDVLASDGARWAQLVLGAGMLAGSFLIGRKREHDSAGTADTADATGAAGAAPPGRLVRWRASAMGAEGSGVGALIGLALAAALVEAGTMVPYLAGIGLLTASDAGTATSVLVLACYVGVMVLPALVLLTVRLLARRAVEPTLRRLEAWMTRTAGETTAWIVGIVGFLLARDAASVLGVLGQG